MLRQPFPIRSYKGVSAARLSEGGLSLSPLSLGGYRTYSCPWS